MKLLKLKITGLRVDGDPVRFPKAGTTSSKIIECLEAESATTEEIANYLDASEDKTRSLLCWLRDKGLIRHDGEERYFLVDPVGASLAYSIEKP